MPLITGRVVRRDGTAVTGARVLVRAGPDGFPDVAQLTAGDGGFAVAVRLPGEYVLAAYTDDGSGEVIARVGAEPVQVVIVIL